MMRFGSVCSGIEAASVAWHPLGWRAEFLAEIEAFPCAVLAHHYPDVPNLGDMTKFEGWPDAALDVLVGGTPCQSFSVAGLRKGLADPRGNLMLTYGAIAARYRPTWLVWENVPGVLSSHGGRDFGTFLGMLAELGYGFAYRVLDAQHFGVPQRRRRVFVVGCLGGWRRAAAVLFERASLRGDPAPRREAGAGTAIGALAGTSPGGGWRIGSDEAAGQLIAFDGQNMLDCTDVAATLDSGAAHGNRGMHVTGTLRGHPRAGSNSLGAIAFAENSRAEVRLEGGAGNRTGALSTGGGKPGQGVPMIAFNARQDPDSWEDRTGPIDTDGSTQAIAYAWAASASQSMNPSDVAPPIRSSRNGEPASGVRRLTPRECERLQGFPDIAERIIIGVCIDRRNHIANVELSCLRWPVSASPANGVESTAFSPTAELDSRSPRVGRAPLAAVYVLPQSAGDSAEIRSRARSHSHASGASVDDWSHRAMLPEPTVRSLAPVLRELAHSIRAGKVASPLSMLLSTAVLNGASRVQTCGGGIEDGVADANGDRNTGTFTTSELGLLRQISDSREQILCCSAMAAIAGCIPSETLPVNFSLELTIVTPYTAISVRGKPAADGPRYKALGNSMAVPCMRWVGERIAAVDAIERREAA